MNIFIDILHIVHGRVTLKPPKKSRKSRLESFFHAFFAISCHVRSNTCSKVMILYSKGKSMLLNTFLIFFRCQNKIFACSQTQEINMVHKKNAKNHPKFEVFFGDFLVNHVYFLCLRARKNYFGTEIILETCSATSTYT